MLSLSYHCWRSFSHKLVLSLALKKTNIEHIFLAKYVIQGCKKVNKWHRHSKSASSTAKVVMLSLCQTPGWGWRGLKSLHLFSMSRFQIQSSLLSFCLCHLALMCIDSAVVSPLDSLTSIGCVVELAVIGDELYIKNTDGLGRFRKTIQVVGLGQ
jgi:hypothetical protein